MNAGDPDADFYVREPYLEKVLSIEVFDGNDGERVWHGTGTTRVLRGNDIGRAAARTVRAILDEFPAEAGESFTN